ncbi:MAG: hypothetical protein M0Z50_10755 [Planctomycetia bacterium]|nr:hypothetical protein [Planctomycetia bacterium]
MSDTQPISDPHADSRNSPGEPNNLEGYNPRLDSLPMVRDVVEKAFSYRGDVTIVRRQGGTVEGYIFDRRAECSDTSQWNLRLIIKDSTERITIPYHDIASINFSGKNPAAGRSFQTWLKKYHEKKAAGESNIRLDPETL